MLSGKPLFPGQNPHHQLTLILDVLGTPALDQLYTITTQKSRNYIYKLPARTPQPFARLFPNANPQAVDFLTKALVSLSVIVGFHLMLNILLVIDRHLTPRNVSQFKTRWPTHIWQYMYPRSFNFSTVSSHFPQHDPNDEPVAPRAFDFARECYILLLWKCRSSSEDICW
jgi:hypothetical protein